MRLPMAEYRKKKARKGGQVCRFPSTSSMPRATSASPGTGALSLDVPARMIAHEDKAEERAQQGDGADGDEGAAPARRRHQGGEGRRPEEGAQHAHGGADGRHRPEVRGREPARRDL